MKKDDLIISNDKIGEIETQPYSIAFTENNNPDPIMIISQGKFFWKGEEIEDIHKIYERFDEWLKGVECYKRDYQ